MAYAESHTVSLTTDASGDATGYTPVVSGKVETIIYTKDDFATGVDFTITSEDTGQTIWQENDVDASKTVSPRQTTHATDGTEHLYAASGTAVSDEIMVAKERIKFVVANGGNAKSGTFIVVVA